MENSNVIRTDGFLKNSLRRYKETYEQWIICRKNKTGKEESMPDLEVMLALAIEDEIKILKDMMAGDNYTVEECQRVYELYGYGVILNDGKIMGLEKKAG